MEQERKRRRQILTAGIASVVVVAVVVVLIAVKLTGGSGHGAAAPTGPEALAPGDVVTTLTNIPASQLASAAKTTAAVPPNPIKGQAALTSSGLPQIVYVGAEYCPYCAAERWAVVTALSKFGTFTGLGQTQSSSTDIDPNTVTFSFHGAGYTSQYLTFDPVEEQDNTGAKLDTPSTLQAQLVSTFDKAPYTTSSSGSSAGGIPFIDLGNRFIVSGASYDPALLAKMSVEQAAAAAADPTTKLGQAVQAAAGQVTADICQLTNNQPASVCSAFNGG
jgi:hypothetical protein